MSFPWPGERHQFFLPITPYPLILPITSPRRFAVWPMNRPLTLLPKYLEFLLMEFSQSKRKFQAICTYRVLNNTHILANILKGSAHICLKKQENFGWSFFSLYKDWGFDNNIILKSKIMILH